MDIYLMWKYIIEVGWGEGRLHLGFKGGFDGYHLPFNRGY